MSLGDAKKYAAEARAHHNLAYGKASEEELRAASWSLLRAVEALVADDEERDRRVDSLIRGLDVRIAALEARAAPAPEPLGRCGHAGHEKWGQHEKEPGCLGWSEFKPARAPVAPAPSACREDCVGERPDAIMPVGPYRKPADPRWASTWRCDGSGPAHHQEKKP